jgi:DNA repair exonuclease SbcCD ATPase subunit
MLKYQGYWIEEVAMTDQTTGTPAIVPYAPKEKGTDSEAEIVDRAGKAILGLVSRAADAAAADLEEAREVAEKLADQLRAAHEQLRAAHEQINDLKVDVRHYQDRTNRAEKWLQQISSEVEQKFLGADNSRAVRRRAPSQNENNNPAALAFLRRQQDH